LRFEPFKLFYLTKGLELQKLLQFRILIQDLIRFPLSDGEFALTRRFNVDKVCVKSSFYLDPSSVNAGDVMHYSFSEEVTVEGQAWCIEQVTPTVREKIAKNVYLTL
jgi:hypothetical protein